MLVSFARGLYPKGSVDSLVSRIEDGIISSLADLFEISLDELTDLDRVRLWKQPLPVSSSAGEKRRIGDSNFSSSSNLSSSSAKFPRSKDLSERLCFKCHKPGHIASACRDTKAESVFLLSTPHHISNPLSRSGEK
ncbi:hypothetical protein RCL1_001474 [Eukaryota sp. TZLM3-RCL]